MTIKTNNIKGILKGKPFDFSINPHSLKILITYFSVISALELLAYGIGGFFSVLAAYIWLLTGFFFLGYFLFCTGLQIVKDIRERKFFLLGGFLVLILFLSLFIGNVSFSDINPDATQQIAAGLESFEHADLNYTQTAFLGYPNRQYVIAAIPSLLFGRSLIAFHLGFSLMFLAGLTVLFLSLRKWVVRNGSREEYALLPCFALIAFPFISEYYLNFEQAITPVALTMIGLGLFLRLYMDTDIISVLSLSYIGCLMADSYTPVLASLGLLAVFLFIFAAKSDKKCISYACIGCAINIIIFFFVTYISGRSDRLTDFRENTSVVKSAFEYWKEFFTDANVRFLGLFSGVIILYMLLSFTLRLKKYDLLISLWVLGVIFFSNYMVGYTAYDKAWVMQRNMVVIPVLTVCIFLALIDFLGKYRIAIVKPIQIIILTFLFVISIFHFYQPHHSFKYFSFVQPMKYAINYIRDVLDENGLKASDEFNLIIYTDNGLQSNIRDYAAYFYPNAVTYSETGCTYNSNIDYSKPSLYFAEDDRLTALEPDNSGSEEYIEFLQAPTLSKTFSNPRYDSTITWYSKFIPITVDPNYLP